MFESLFSLVPNTEFAPIQWMRQTVILYTISNQPTRISHMDT